MPPVLSPTTISTTFVSLDAGSAHPIEVRRDRRLFLLRWLRIGAVLAILPLLMPIKSREPDYFIGAMIVISIIIALLIVGATVLVAYIWSRTVGRAEFDEPLLRIGADGLRSGDVPIPWSQVRGVRVVGRWFPQLLIDADDSVSESIVMKSIDMGSADAEDAESQERSDSADLAESVQYDGPVTYRPSDEDFAAIESVPPEAIEIPQTAQTVHSATPAAPRSAWSELTDGPPYAIGVGDCAPPLTEILEAIASLSGGAHRPSASPGQPSTTC